MKSEGRTRWKSLVLGLDSKK